MINPLDKNLELSQKLLDLFEQLKNNEEIKKYIVKPSDTPKETQCLIKIIGVTSKQIYYVPDIESMSEELFELRNKIDLELLKITYAYAAEPIDHIVKQFAAKGYPARFIETKAKDVVEFTGADIVINGVSYVVLMPTF